MESPPPPLPESQEGGRFIDKGVYGCIFDPPLLCRNRLIRGKPGRIGKYTKKEDAATELEFARRVLRDPRARKYLILPELDTVCEALPPEQQREKDLGKCDVLLNLGPNRLIQFQEEFGGVPFLNKITQIEKVAQFQSDDIRGILDFWPFMLRMLEIGAFLVLNGVIHNDIHSKNILIGKGNLPKLIDYGRSYFANAITQKVLDNLSAEYDPELSQVPPEYTAQDGLETGVPFSQILYDLRTKKRGIELTERILGISRSTQIEEFRKFWTSSRAIRQNQWIKMWQIYWPGVDAWAIGSNILSALRRFLMSRRFESSPEWKKRGSLVKAVLRGLVRLTPAERLDCVEALALYDPTNELITSGAGRTWLEKKQASRVSV